MPHNKIFLSLISQHETMTISPSTGSWYYSRADIHWYQKL